jgi:hypothetical protein
VPLKYLLDEHLRGPLWRGIQTHNALDPYPLDAVRVGDPPDLPLGCADPEILIWAERENRIFVTADRSTTSNHLAAHLAAGRRSPGILMVARGTRINDVLSFLVLAAYVGEPAEWEDRIHYVET